MKSIGIFYGSSTGHTENDANIIAQSLGVSTSNVHNVEKVSPSKVADYDLLVFGSSTWGNGDMQDDWENFIAAVSAMELGDKKIALFGTGDVTMSDTFCNAVGELYDALKGTHAHVVGEFNTDGLDFNHSSAVKGGDGMAVGLLLDDVNHADLTPKRIEEWAKTLLTLI